MHITNETIAKGSVLGLGISKEFVWSMGCSALYLKALCLTLCFLNAIALLPPPVAANYRIMGAVCVTATFLTLCSNVLYMLRGWQEPLPFYDWSSNGIRWMTSQIWYAIGMIFLFHVVTRPAQSGVVLFGKFPRDLWSFKVRDSKAGRLSASLYCR